MVQIGRDDMEAAVVLPACRQERQQLPHFEQMPRPYILR